MKNSLFVQNSRRFRLMLEALESRVAPTAVPLTFITDFAAEMATDTPKNALKAGDTGFFDADKNGLQATNGSEPTLIRLSAGKALVFLNDTHDTGILNSDEITGLSLGAGAKAEVFFPLNGSVLTDLQPDGTLSDGTGNGTHDGQKLEAASIASLTVHGSVGGSIVAGGSISNVKVEGTIGAGSRGQVLTGDAGGGLEVTFLGSRFALDSFTPAVGAIGGDVNGLTSNGFVGTDFRGVITGDGGVGARAGNISHVTMLAPTTSYDLQTGNGGVSAIGVGGAGGSISSFLQIGGTSPVVTLTTGNGGSSKVSAGGNGGSISGVLVGGATGEFDLTCNNGGSSVTAGGAGGSIDHVTIHTNSGNVTLQGGTGGTAGNTADTGIGGRGGSLSVVTVATDNTSSSVTLNGGNGGQGDGVSGNGGSISSCAASAGNTVSITSGTGADLFTTANPLAIAGMGGSISNGVFASTSRSVSVETGSGGSGNIGNDSGSISNIVVTHSIGGDMSTGSGGTSSLDTASRRADGGDSGSITHIKLLDDMTINNFDFATGDAGQGTATGGRSGLIDDVKAVSYKATMRFSTGDGGVGANVTNANPANGGASGSISHINVSTGGFVSITTGSGGDGEVRGGSAGAISGVSGMGSSFDIETGSGGSADSKLMGSNGGNGGLNTLHQLLGTSGAVILRTGDGGNGSVGGRAGDVTFVIVTRSYGAAITTGTGGNSTLDTANATANGGDGGTINHVKFLEDNSNNGVSGFFAGGGGDGTRTGGAGGSIKDFAIHSNRSVTMLAGDGGAGSNQVNATPANGGSGGSFASLNVYSTGNLIMNAGGGGSGESNGGNGGGFFNDKLGTATWFTLRAGSGGSSTTAVGAKATLGVGGDINMLTLTGDGSPLADINIDTVAPGGNGPIGRRGGDVGAVVVDHVSTVNVFGGTGGATTGDGFAGGRGGNISNLIVRNASGAVSIAGGDGGNGTRNGGNGGNMTALNIQAGGDVTISDANGGAGSNAAKTGIGGNGGSATGLVLSTGDTLTIGGMNGGNGDQIGGAGGSLTKLQVTGLGGIGIIWSGAGGATTDTGTAFRGGNGGNISSVTVSGIGASGYVRSIAAGDGGNAHNTGGTALGGSGGSLGDINVFGNIGNHTLEYGISSQGGLFAGAAGVGDKSGATDGSIINVRGQWITSIAAGKNVIPMAPALIDNIVAAIIGADLGDGSTTFEGVFDFKDTLIANGHYDFGEQPIDGIVIAQKVGSKGLQSIYGGTLVPMCGLVF